MRLSGTSQIRDLHCLYGAPSPRSSPPSDTLSGLRPRHLLGATKRANTDDREDPGASAALSGRSLADRGYCFVAETKVASCEPHARRNASQRTPSPPRVVGTIAQWKAHAGP